MSKTASSPSLVELKVARKIASLRQDSNLTLRALGNASGLSDAYLSRVENGKTAINIANLSRLAEALGVEVSACFESEKVAAPLTICRAGEGRKMRFRSPRGVQVQLLAEGKKDKLMEPIWVDLSAAGEDPVPQSHSGQEFMHILRGRCRFHFARQVWDLGEGDSVYFDSEVDHAAVAVPGTPCHAIAVVTSRDYHFHGNIMRLLDE